MHLKYLRKQRCFKYACKAMPLKALTYGNNLEVLPRFKEADKYNYEQLVYIVSKSALAKL